MCSEGEKKADKRNSQVLRLSFIANLYCFMEDIHGSYEKSETSACVLFNYQKGVMSDVRIDERLRGSC